MLHNVPYSQGRNTFYLTGQQNKHVLFFSVCLLFKNICLYCCKQKIFMFPMKNDLLYICKLGENML